MVELHFWQCNQLPPPPPPQYTKTNFTPSSNFDECRFLDRTQTSTVKVSDLNLCLIWLSFKEEMFLLF